MKAAKTWCLAGFMVVLGLASASCGKDEGTGNGDHGTVIGGSGGSGGNTNTGRAGGDTGTVGTNLGKACVNDSQCTDVNAPGLKCVTAKDQVLDDGAPPKGLCTMPCTKNGDCQDLGAGAICYGFTDDAAYCIEGCAFGKPEIGEKKCHDRPEFACSPVMFDPTDTKCQTSDDCDQGEWCDDGICDVVYTACLPSCRGDIDCEAGSYCDQTFGRGTCVAKKQSGKALGEPCTVPADNAPRTADECLGICQRDAVGSSKGHCGATCALGRECAYNTTTNKFDGVCLFPSSLNVKTGSTGDFGFCTLACDCTDACLDPDLGCTILDETPLPTDAFRGAGFCVGTKNIEAGQEYNQCTDGTAGAGAGGDGNVPSAGAGAGGEPSTGDAGAPAVGGATGT